jgi:tRNA pseudouridine32 synthase/23S rRNA pseudouridine746 synthase
MPVEALSFFLLSPRHMTSAFPPSSPSDTPDVAYAPPEDTGLAIVHLDEHLLVVDKPAGLLTVPGRGQGREDCLVSRVQLRYPDALVVHRLDMATSGLVVLARGNTMQRRLSALFQEREVNKVYTAIVHGLIDADEGEVDLPLITDWPRRPMQMVCHRQGKASLTHFKVLAREAGKACTRVALAPVTGRSHQLRVHMLALGHAIVGDPLYGEREMQSPHPRLMLHASRLTLPHPGTGAVLSTSSVVPF